MKIYFDNVLIDEDNYMSYSDNFSSFEDSFYLGSSASLHATLQIPITAWPGYLDSVRIEVDGNAIATLKLDNITVNDDNSITLDLVDVLTHTSTECDFSSLITYKKVYNPETDEYEETGTGITAGQLYNFICSIYGIYSETQIFTNQDVMIYSYDNSLTGRNYLEMIAELAGGYLHIDPWGTLSIKYYNRDSLNLFNKNAIPIHSGATESVLNTGIRLTQTLSGNYKYASFKIGESELLGKKITISSNMSPGGENLPGIWLYFGRNGNVATQSLGALTNSGHVTITIPDSFTGNTDRVNLLLYSNVNGTGEVGSYVDYTNLQVQIGEESTPYEEYEKTFNPKPEDVLTYDEVDSYKLSEKIEIQRVVYDNGITTPFKSSEDESLYTLYLSTENLFFQTMTEADFQKICDNIIGYNFYNIHIDNCNKFFENGSTIWFQREDESKVPIIVNYSREFMGGFIGSYDTNISNAKKTETQVIPTETKIQRLKTIINQMDNSLTIQASKADNLKQQTTQLRIDLNSVQSLFQITGGSNLIRNSQFLLPDEVWEFTEDPEDSLAYHTPIGDGYNASLIGETTAVANIKLRNSKATTISENIVNLKTNTAHNLNYYISQDSNTTTYVRLISKTTGDNVFEDIISTNSNQTVTKKNYSHDFIANDSDYIFEIETNTTISGYCYIYDLMLNSGDKKSWEPAASEIYSTILKMSQLGMQVYSSGSGILTLITADGFQVREARDSGEGGIILGRIVSQFNSEGIITEIVRMTKAVIGKYIQEELTLNNFIHHVEYFEE